ncbi:hypothetical protein P3T40_001998 [Paraburkholderia sp. EB58]|uniref:DUF1799 domain-containing protein n=1 Tax=Paraburkholderia sp. EB58 TaxID=3035125 RepID=UPI003D1A26A3
MARHWAGERPDEFAADESVVAALAAAGAPVEAVDAARVQAAQDDCHVWADNWEVFQTFVALSGQWRYLTHPMGPPQTLGLDYSRVESALRLMGFGPKKRIRLFRLIRLMEGEALDVHRAREAAQQNA